MNEIITVYSAEIMRRVRSRTFMVGLLFGMLGVAAMIELPHYFAQYSEQNKHVLIAGDPVIVSMARPMLDKDFTIVGTRASTSAPSPQELQARKAAAVIAITRTPSGIRVAVFAKDPSEISTPAIKRDLIALNLRLGARLQPHQIDSLIRIPVTTQAVASKFGTAAQADAAKAIAYILLLLLYILIMVNSQLIMSSVAEEKTSRIAELLVASVRPNALLTGKVAASATLAIAQMVIWVAVAYVLGSQAAGTGASTSMSSSRDLNDFTLNGVSQVEIVSFVLFFLIGFLQTSTLFAAVASLVNRTEDLGSLNGPMVLPVVAAFLIAISSLAVPDSPAVVVTSFVPLIAPFVMFARIVVSSVPVWQVALSLGINVLAIYVIAILSGRIYRIGMLLYGRAPRIGQIWNVLRQS